jgi:anti-anti-sigma factor
MLQFSIRQSGDMVVLRCKGRLVAGQGLRNLHSTAVRQQGAGLVLDFAEIETLDAAGIGTLLRIRQWCGSQGMSLKLVNLNPRVREVLALTALDSVVELQPGETAREGMLREWACAEK